MSTLIDLLERAVTRFGDRPALGLRSDDGSGAHCSYRELDRRARIAAWRLRALNLEPGDRILTWSPSTPELPAAYFGAMHARLVIVPLDLRMSADAVATIVRASGARHLVLGTGRDARSEEHTSELQSQSNLVCRLLLEKKKKNTKSSF